MSKNAKKIKCCRECPIMIMAPYAQGTLAKASTYPYCMSLGKFLTTERGIPILCPKRGKVFEWNK